MDVDSHIHDLTAEGVSENGTTSSKFVFVDLLTLPGEIMHSIR